MEEEIPFQMEEGRPLTAIMAGDAGVSWEGRQRGGKSKTKAGGMSKGGGRMPRKQSKLPNRKDKSLLLRMIPPSCSLDHGAGDCSIFLFFFITSY